MKKLLQLTLLFGLMLGLTSTASAAPQLAVLAPTSGAIIAGNSVTVQVNVSEFELVHAHVPLDEAGQHPEANEPGKGMVHLKLDLQPLVILDQGSSYTFTNVPPGQHQLEVELASNDHSLLSPPVLQVISFATVAEMPVGLPATGATAQPVDFAPPLGLGVMLLLLGGLLLRRLR